MKDPGKAQGFNTFNLKENMQLHKILSEHLTQSNTFNNT